MIRPKDLFSDYTPIGHTSPNSYSPNTPLVSLSTEARWSGSKFVTRAQLQQYPPYARRLENTLFRDMT